MSGAGFHILYFQGDAMPGDPLKGFWRPPLALTGPVNTQINNVLKYTNIWILSFIENRSVTEKKNLKNYFRLFS